MNAQPLIAGDIVRAYACGTCWRPGAMGAHGGAYGERDVARSRADAEACCVCETCGMPLAANGAYLRCCDACNSTDVARRQAIASAEPVHSTPCDDCLGSGSCKICRSGDCVKCDGKGTV